MTMISGIYGMNIVLPMQENPWAFVILMGFMFSMALITVLVFKRKKRF